MGGPAVTLQKVGKQIRFPLQYSLNVDYFVNIIHILTIDATGVFWLQIGYWLIG